ncbi:hypothetical protein VTH82DRAFT_4064 [Thermothelomyces myriococcoides]
MVGGDVATTLLNSCLIACGLKLYGPSHIPLLPSPPLRAHHFLGPSAGQPDWRPAVAHTVLGEASPRKALAFAPQNVISAVKDAVMGIPSGDGGLNAAMIVGVGIMHQTGDWVGNREMVGVDRRKGGGGGKEGDEGEVVAAGDERG